MDHPHRRWRCRWLGAAGGDGEAPRLERLGGAPTPHGSVLGEASRDRVSVESPVPVQLDLAGRVPERLPAGRHERKTG